MAGSPYVKPTNAILVAGSPMTTTQKIETVTNMYPGRLVEKGTNDDDIVVGTAGGDVQGFLGYEQTLKKHRPATVDTIYLVNAQVVVLSGGRFVVVGSLASGQNVTMGARLVAAAAGELTVATAATITIATGTVAVTSDKSEPDEAVAGSVGAQGIVVAIAVESVDASGGAADIMVRSLI